jgi:hypothetical protein
MLFVLLALLLGLPACTNGDCCNSNPNPNQGVNPVGLDLEVCWNKPPSTTKYIRIQSKAGGISGTCPDNVGNAHLNIYVWHDYQDEPVGGTPLTVCADQAIPTGWEDTTGAYPDPVGCDAAAHPAGYANVRKYRRDN